MRILQFSAVPPILSLVASNSVWPDVLLTESFETQGQWRKQIRGKATVELVDGGFKGKCLKITSADKGMGYYSIDLDPKRVRGMTLMVRAKVKLDNVVQGAEPWCRAKIHVGTWVNKKLLHRPNLFDGTKDWHDQKLVAPIDERAERVVLDLAIQMGSGTAYFDELVVDDGLKPLVPLALKPVANTSYSDGVADDGRGGFIDTGELDLRELPTGDVQLGGCEFRIMRPGDNSGVTCVALRGLQRPKLPAKPKGVIKVGHKGHRLLFLQAAAWPDAERKTPCLVYTVRFADGKTVKVAMREGVDLGAFDAPRDLPNWKVAWKTERAGRTVGLGVTEWRNPRPDIAIQSIAVETPGKGAVPIVVAITLDRKG